jgi:hypothetical protein
MSGNIIFVRMVKTRPNHKRISLSGAAVGELANPAIYIFRIKFYMHWLLHCLVAVLQPQRR